MWTMEVAMYTLLVMLLSAVLTASQSSAPHPPWRQGLKVCGDVEYHPEDRCCCGTVHIADIPEKDCQCCGDKAYRRNETKPDHCMDVCGGVPFHGGTQLCCGGVVWNSTYGEKRDSCCGQELINVHTHDCCGIDETVEVPVPIRAGYKCCGKGESGAPYHNSTLRCNRTSGEVSVRGGIRFHGQDVCEENLTMWFAKLPPPQLRNKTDRVHIRGMPQGNELVVRRTRNEEMAVVIPLIPFIVTGQQLDPACRTADTLDLVIKLPLTQDCLDKQDQLRAYFRGTVLDVFARKNVTCMGSPGRPFLRLKNKHKAVIFRSQDASALLAHSLQRH